jgi:hypothetical protein
MTDRLVEPTTEKTTYEKVASEYDSELKRVRELMDLAFSGGATSTSAREDRVVFPLLVACRDITEEVLFAIKDGFGRAALRSTRTMYECVVTARHLHLHPEKTEKFLAIFHAEWARVYQDIPKQYRDAKTDSMIAVHVPKYAEDRYVGMKELDWSDAQVHKMAEEAGRLAELHPFAYTLPSAYIHPGAMFCLRMLSASAESKDVFEISEDKQEWASMQALRNAHDLLLNAVDLRLKYQPTNDLQNLFDDCSADFSKAWGYGPHI